MKVQSREIIYLPEQLNLFLQYNDLLIAPNFLLQKAFD